jgi:hypothetical protein
VRRPREVHRECGEELMGAPSMIVYARRQMIF